MTDMGGTGAGYVPPSMVLPAMLANPVTIRIYNQTAYIMIPRITET